MRGLIIWAYSDCRSTMGLYKSIKEQCCVPVVIALWHYPGQCDGVDLRAKTGFSANEFFDVEMVPIGEDYQRGLALMDRHGGWNHLFCVYQKSVVFRKLMQVAKSRGENFGVMSESPCNMKTGFKSVLWEIYVRTLLKWRIAWVVKNADFFVNFSGDSNEYAKIIGWRSKKIIPFGYYPPPIPGSTMILRKENRPFRILATGILSKYRGTDILIGALRILKDRGVKYEVVITQEGPLLNDLKMANQKGGLGISFEGRVPLQRLLQLYAGCSVFVGAGRSEPWGMRLNDALNCGAPLVVSSGMGGVKMISDYGCGLSFKNEDIADLANKLELLAKDNELYREIAAKAYAASESCAPECKAKELMALIAEKCEGWFS